MRWMTRVLAALVSAAALAAPLAAAAELTAAQIVEKNVAARGGLEAWRKIRTMVWVGHIESANAPGGSLPFVLEMERPDKTRFDIRAQNQLSVRIFDGEYGWNVRPSRMGPPELQDYSPEEVKYARDAGGLDGPLMDYEAKGVAVALDGTDEVEGHRAYRLSVALPSGARHHVWIDAESFLEIKSDREARNQFGLAGTLSVFYRDYRTIDGLQIPMTIETSGADRAKGADRMVLDKVVLNPPLDERAFAKPRLPKARRGAPAGPSHPPVPRARPDLTLPQGAASLSMTGSGGNR